MSTPTLPTTSHVAGDAGHPADHDLLATAAALAVYGSNNGSDFADPGSTRYNLREPVLGSCQAAATTNLTLSGTQTVDGYSAAVGDQILCTAQSTGSNNGPWIVASGSWTRPTDYTNAAVVKGRAVQVVAGSAANIGLWTMLTSSSVTVGTTATTWAPAGAARNDGRYLTIGPVNIVTGADPTGTADSTAAITATIALGGITWIPAGTYSVTQLVLPSGTWLQGAGYQGSGYSGSGGVPPAANVTKLQPLTGTTQTEMIKIAINTGTVVMRDIYFTGHNGGTNPYTKAVISFDDQSVFSNDFSLIQRCRIDYSSGDNIYYGLDRGGLRVKDCISFNATGSGISIYGSDVTVDNCELANNAYGYYISGTMTRIRDCDIFTNTVGGHIVASNVYVRDCSHDQNTQTGIQVANTATGVELHGRFDGNGSATTATYAHIDITAAASGGVTLSPGTQFTANSFGSATTTYDVHAGSNSFYDYSTYAATSSAAHTDVINLLAVAPVVANVDTVTLTAGGTQAVPDVTVDTLHAYTFGAGNITFTFPAAHAGKSFTIALKQDATGSRTVTWPGSARWSAGTAPTLTTTASKTDYIRFVCSDGTHFDGSVMGANY